MRLSLRTLLAFEDNLFDIEQQRQLERTIPHDEAANQSIARIRNAVHDPYLSVPGIVDRQEELDPNIVAEYLDHQMSSEYLDQFENFCFSNDKYLAEVASAHQIISNVLGEPARTNRECRFRCYDLFPSVRQETWQDTEEISEEEQAILKLKNTPPEQTPFPVKQDESKIYRFNLVTGEKEAVENDSATSSKSSREESKKTETDPKKDNRVFWVFAALLLLLVPVLLFAVLSSKHHSKTKISENIPADRQITSIPQSDPQPIKPAVQSPLERQDSKIIETKKTVVVSELPKELPTEKLSAKLPAVPVHAPPVRPAVDPTIQNLSGYGVSDPFAVAMSLDDGPKEVKPDPTPIKEEPSGKIAGQTADKSKKKDSKETEVAPKKHRMQPLEPLRKKPTDSLTTENSSSVKTEKNSSNSLRNVSTTKSDVFSSAPASTPEKNHKIATASAMTSTSVFDEVPVNETLQNGSAFDPPEAPVSDAESTTKQTTTEATTDTMPKKTLELRDKLESFPASRVVDEASISFPSDPPAGAKISFHPPTASDSPAENKPTPVRVSEPIIPAFPSFNDQHYVGNLQNDTVRNEQKHFSESIKTAEKKASMSKNSSYSVQDEKIETFANSMTNSPGIHNDPPGKNSVATASLIQPSDPFHEKSKQAAEAVDRKSIRNEISPILPVVGFVEQRQSEKKIEPNEQTANQLKPQTPEPVQRILGKVLPSNEPIIVFSAASANSPWKMEQGELDLYAEQYLLTATPFRAEIELVDDFRIEMIGDSKLCVMPPDEKGIPGIFLDYGRLVIRTKNNYGRNNSSRIKTLRIRTEKSEGVVTISGPKSLAFIDTFAEVVEGKTLSDKNGPENELVPQTAPILGLLPDPTESVSWTFSGRDVPYVANRDTSFLLDEGRYDHGAIKHHPNWIRRLSLPPEGLEIESACRRIFRENRENCENSLHAMIRDSSLAVRSFGLRLWGDLGRFDVPLSVLDETKEKNEPINVILTGYFRDVMKRDEESVQRLADAIQTVRR